MGRLKETLDKLSDDERQRAATKVISWDYTVAVWPNRKALAKSVRMQQQRAHQNGDWSPVVKLTDGEGF